MRSQHREPLQQIRKRLPLELSTLPPLRHIIASFFLEVPCLADTDFHSLSLLSTCRLDRLSEERIAWYHYDASQPTVNPTLRQGWHTECQERRLGIRLLSPLDPIGKNEVTFNNAEGQPSKSYASLKSQNIVLRDSSRPRILQLRRQLRIQCISSRILRGVRTPITSCSSSEECDTDNLLYFEGCTVLTIRREEQLQNRVYRWTRY